jgi:threonine/homoserine/homoserine lactone efflux protein
MKNPFIIWPSVILWLLAIIAVFISEENEVINAIALLSSFWLVYLWWILNKSRKGKI